jgi:hypothetical protein
MGFKVSLQQSRRLIESENAGIVYLPCLSKAAWRLSDVRPGSPHASWSAPCRDCRRDGVFRDQYPFTVSYALMCSRVARIIRSVLIALSDPSLRLVLASTNASSFQRSFSNSSSRSKVIAYLRFLSRRGISAGDLRSRQKASDAARMRAHHDLQPTSAGISGVVRIDHFRRVSGCAGRAARATSYLQGGDVNRRLDPCP